MHKTCIIDFLAKIRTWWYTEMCHHFFSLNHHPMFQIPKHLPLKKKKRAESAPFGTPLIRSRSAMCFNPFAFADMGFHMHDLLTSASLGHMIRNLRLVNIRSTPRLDRLGSSSFSPLIKDGIWPYGWQLHFVTKFIPHQNF